MDKKERRKRRHDRYWKNCMRDLYYFSIPTTRSRILQYCSWDHMASQLQAIIGYGREHPDYRMRLAVYAWQIYTLFRLTYLGKDGTYKKLPAERYARELFLDSAESPEELSVRYFTEETREAGFRIYKAVCDAISPMLAHQSDDRFWPDHVAFLVDYIIARDGDVPPPDMEQCIVPYPKNYPRPYENEERHFLPEEIAI